MNWCVDMSDDILLRPAITELIVSQPCEHGCFELSVGGAFRAYLPGAGVIEGEPRDTILFHARSDDGPCGCFVDDVRRGPCEG